MDSTTFSSKRFTTVHTSNTVQRVKVHIESMPSGNNANRSTSRTPGGSPAVKKGFAAQKRAELKIKDGKITGLEDEIIELGARNASLTNYIQRLEAEKLEADQIQALKNDSQLHTISATEYKIGNIIFNPRNKIGPGSTGNMVFEGKVVDDSGERECAVKKIPIMKPKDLERALEESRIMKDYSRTCENLMEYIESRHDETHNDFYIAMPLCSMTLDRYSVG